MRAPPVLLALGLMAFVVLSQPSRYTTPAASQTQPLPSIAPAPGFTLVSQDAAQVSLSDFHGKVVAVTFIFTRCSSTCPV